MLFAFQALILTVFPALVIAAALKDVISYTIPNRLNLALGAAFLPAAFALGLSPSEIGVHLAVGAGAMVLGVFMFAMRWIGGGDAKLLAAAALWLGLAPAGPFLLVTTVAGGALALMLLGLRSDLVKAHTPVGPGWVERLATPGAPAPYGVAICIGGLYAFPQSALMKALEGSF